MKLTTIMALCLYLIGQAAVLAIMAGPSSEMMQNLFLVTFIACLTAPAVVALLRAD